MALDSAFSISPALADISLLHSAGGDGRAFHLSISAADYCHPAVHQKITAQSGVCSSCMRVAFPHLVSPPILRWSVTPLGYLTIRMLSAGVSAPGRVCRPVRVVRNGREFPQDATVPSQAPKPRIHKAGRWFVCCVQSLGHLSTGEPLCEGERSNGGLASCASRLGSPMEARELKHS